MRADCLGRRSRLTEAGGRSPPAAKIPDFRDRFPGLERSPREGRACTPRGERRARGPRAHPRLCRGRAAAPARSASGQESRWKAVRIDASSDRCRSDGGAPLPDPSPAPEPLDPAHRDRVYAFALRLSGDRHFADDIAQETLIRALRPGVPRDLPYLFRIALNLVRSEKRTPASRTTSTGVPMDRVADSRTPGPLETLEKREQAEAYWRSVGLLPDRERTALLMRYGEGLACADIALALGTTTNAVSCLLRRGRDRLEALLDPRSQP